MWSLNSPKHNWTTLLKQIFINIFFSTSASGHRPADGSAHSSSGSFHSSRGPLGIHISWTDKPTGRGVNQHHNHPSNSDSYRENIVAAEYEPPHGRELKLPVAKPNVDKEKKTLRDIIPPLCAYRLKPIRQKTKNAVVRYCSYFLMICWFSLSVLFDLFFLFFFQVSILDTGEVCMELLKSQSGQERVKEVLRISCDGSMVSSFSSVSYFRVWPVGGSITT